MENKIKEGDIVRVSKNAPKLCVRGWRTMFITNDSTVICIEDDIAGIAYGPNEMVIPCKYLIKVGGEEKPAEQTERQDAGGITIPADVELGDSFYEAYKADLAREIVLKTVNCASDKRPSAIAGYATDIARQVVEKLREE